MGRRNSGPVEILAGQGCFFILRRGLASKPIGYHACTLGRIKAAPTAMTIIAARSNSINVVPFSFIRITPSCRA